MGGEGWRKDCGRLELEAGQAPRENAPCWRCRSGPVYGTVTGPSATAMARRTRIMPPLQPQPEARVESTAPADPPGNEWLRPADLLLAETVIAERYRIEGLVGRGGHGLVYAARHVETGQRVAVKVLWCADGRPDPAATGRLQREARMTASLTHPNTVRVLDCGLHDGTPYLAMEWLAGTTLEQRLRASDAESGPMPSAEAVAVGIEVLRSLQEAHARGLVHRDIKPSNIMMVPAGDGDLHVKVLDFGIAHDLESGAATTGLRGTPAYMSPEQCDGRPVDRRGDLYSLAVVLYRCVSGRLPFDAADGAAMMRAHVARPPTDLRTVARVPESLADCIHRALSKDPAGRFCDAAGMRQALEAVDGPAAMTPRHRAGMAASIRSRAVAAVLSSMTGMALGAAPSHAPHRRLVLPIAGFDTSPLPAPPTLRAPVPRPMLASPAPPRPTAQATIQRAPWAPQVRVRRAARLARPGTNKPASSSRDRSWESASQAAGMASAEAPVAVSRARTCLD